MEHRHRRLHPHYLRQGSLVDFLHSLWWDALHKIGELWLEFVREDIEEEMDRLIPLWIVGIFSVIDLVLELVAKQAVEVIDCSFHITSLHRLWTIQVAPFAAQVVSDAPGE